MWNAVPMLVPWVAASFDVMAGVTDDGQVIFSPGPALALGRSARKRTPTSPAGIAAPAMGAKEMLWPDPVGMYPNVEGSSVTPP